MWELRERIKKLNSKKYLLKQSVSQKTFLKIVSMIVHRKENKKNSKKPIFYRKPFSQNPIPNIVSMGYRGKIIKNNSNEKVSKENHFHKKLS